MHFNLVNEEYLFTIIEKIRKRITKSESVLCSQTLSLFALIYLVVGRVCMSERVDNTCIKTSTRLSAKLHKTNNLNNFQVRNLLKVIQYFNECVIIYVSYGEFYGK